MTDTKKLLAERAKTHGEYSEHARITQGIMDLIMSGRSWPTLPPIMRESLHMFAHKIGRICEGDPHHRDHWDDISGYSVLVSQRLDPNQASLGGAMETRRVPGTGVPVHAVGDPEPRSGMSGVELAQSLLRREAKRQGHGGHGSGNPEAYDYEGAVLGARPVPVEDSNRHADRAEGRGLNFYELSQLPPDEQRGYFWDPERREYRRQ